MLEETATSPREHLATVYSMKRDPKHHWAHFECVMSFFNAATIMEKSSTLKCFFSKAEKVIEINKIVK